MRGEIRFVFAVRSWHHESDMYREYMALLRKDMALLRIHMAQSFDGVVGTCCGV